MQLLKVYHPFHLVTPSQWPALITTGIGNLFICLALAWHSTDNKYLLFMAISHIGVSMYFWLKDIITESTYMGDHTSLVQKGIYLGFILFVISEIFFFIAIFWGFFHSAIAPVIELGGFYPAFGIDSIDPFELPLINTVILLTSGATVTFGHHFLLRGNRKEGLLGAFFTVLAALIFSIFQYIEYVVSTFTISDGIYGSSFFFSTGFHGIHVLIGTIFIAIGLIRLYNYELTDSRHLGYECGIVYWHFVDVVWIFLYISIYYWGS